mmetsp:Transcript_107447/g.314160  ORF Transcript_107447/g.314160 Transcript_107447/m.314160 type:complete len:371 (-) Transcript_107447:162-1274(-)
MLCREGRAKHLDAHAGELVDDGGVVAVPPAPIQMQVPGLLRHDGHLVLVDSTQHRGQELDLREPSAEPLQRADVRARHAIASAAGVQLGRHVAQRSELQRDGEAELLADGGDDLLHEYGGSGPPVRLHERLQALAGRVWGRRPRLRVAPVVRRGGHHVLGLHDGGPLAQVLPGTLQALLLAEGLERRADRPPVALDEGVDPQSRPKSRRDRLGGLRLPVLGLRRHVGDVRHHGVADPREPEDSLAVLRRVLRSKPPADACEVTLLQQLTQAQALQRGEHALAGFGDRRALDEEALPDVLGLLGLAEGKEGLMGHGGRRDHEVLGDQVVVGQQLVDAPEHQTAVVRREQVRVDVYDLYAVDLFTHRGRHGV